jgi:hypothetical protein
MEDIVDIEAHNALPLEEIKKFMPEEVPLGKLSYMKHL